MASSAGKQDGGMTLFSGPQEAVVGSKAQLIRSRSRKLNYIVGKRILWKNTRFRRHRDDSQELEIELCCWQSDCFVCAYCTCVFFLSPRLPAFPHGTQTVLITSGETTISNKINPPWPFPTLDELRSTRPWTSGWWLTSTDWNSSESAIRPNHILIIYDERKCCS